MEYWNFQNFEILKGITVQHDKFSYTNCKIQNINSMKLDI